jgi:core-2/I-Branching enzyme
LQKKVGFTRKIKKSFPKLYGGATWWSLTTACCNYVLDYIKANPSFLKGFNYTFCAEELFFQTIILNSPFKDKVVNNNMRLIIWEMRNGNIPANLDESDLETILKSDKLFARRFEYPVSKPLLEQLKTILKK